MEVSGGVSEGLKELQRRLRRVSGNFRSVFSYFRTFQRVPGGIRVALGGFLEVVGSFRLEHGSNCDGI